jgi:flagellar hook-associated protein 1 FlgK
MNLDGALSIANGGLANVNRQMALVSQNVANANTPGYAAEIATQRSMTANGEGLGVRSGPAIRNIDTTLQAEVFSQNATVAGLQTRQTALQAIDAAQGVPGQGSDIASLLGNLQDQFSTLLNSPDSSPQQSQVVSTATILARGINALSNTYITQRQVAEGNLAAEVTTLNSTIGTIGGLSNQIVVLKASGQSTADLENQRDAVVANLSQLVDIKTFEQPNGDLLVVTSAGLALPIHGTTNPFSINDVILQPAAYYTSGGGGGIDGIMLGGTDVTSQLRGGQIGANITLRDVTLPIDQAELDEFAQNLASRFAQQGRLKLFTDPTGGGVIGPQAGYVGYAGVIQVDPAVLANPALVRDGNPPANPPPTAITPLAGYTDVIQSVLTSTLGSVPPLVSHVNNLGPAANLNVPYAAPATLGQLAATIVASQAQESASTTAQTNTEQAVQTTLASKLSAENGVNMDTEMSTMIKLQNAYGANARVIATVQAMWSQLLQSVT